MRDRDPGSQVAARPLLALALAAIVAGGLSCGGDGGAVGPAGGTATGTPGPGEGPGPARSIGLISTIHDPRLRPLLDAADRWRRERGPARKVLDQVYLVPDVPTFLEALGDWDEHAYFPILIDDPAWTLPFLRAFRPARIVRVRSRRPRPAIAPWVAARLAVARSWSDRSVPDDRLDDPASFPSRLGPTPPGLVLSDAGSPMLAGAAALAAGRFEPLVRLGPILVDESGGPSRFADVLTLPQAVQVARAVESVAAAAAAPHASMGDRCDFLTLAMDWPYRYRHDADARPVRGEHALDDLIGRVLVPGQGPGADLDASRTRWAFVGRLLGGPEASVYRAMGSLFLQPSGTILWNTYPSGGPWDAYAMNLADVILGSFRRTSPEPLHRAGTAASLAAWHRAFDPASRFGLVLVNSSGGPDFFTITGGPGRPSDVPRGVPAAVAMVHSFSAADPMDPGTIAGRWLDQGAFLYYGSMNEPYLQAFRPPTLVAGLAARGMPLVAALRQGEDEVYGRPWRLAYLGDPLYRLLAGSEESSRVRVTPPADELARDHPGWMVREITARDVSLAPGGDEEGRLEGCLTAALGALCGGGGPGGEGQGEGEGGGDAVWRSALVSLERSKLPPGLRPALDELMIDAALHGGEPGRLLDWLLKIPPGEAGPRIERAVETVATARVFDASGRGMLAPALDAWESVLRRRWPAGARFPVQLTERLAAIVEAGPPADRVRFRDRLSGLCREFAAESSRSSLAEALAEPLRRASEASLR
ncbi:hypothetical protein [Aquisphaera insulae]|uniref:hypothetical protein n=1 Tax=Aquisphaera insulae TaxID=2712864 RepID=UPI0013EDC491|nr:hypothetical protein [Aquisphaera insulae]